MCYQRNFLTLKNPKSQNSIWMVKMSPNCILQNPPKLLHLILNAAVPVRIRKKTLDGFLLAGFTSVSFMLHVFLQHVALALVTQVSRLQSADLIQCDSFSTGVQWFCEQM